MNLFHWILIIMAAAMIAYLIQYLIRSNKTKEELKTLRQTYKKALFSTKTLCFTIVVVLLIALIVDTIIFADAIKGLKAANDMIEQLGGEPTKATKEIMSYIFNNLLKILVAFSVIFLLRKKSSAVKNEE